MAVVRYLLPTAVVLALAPAALRADDAPKDKDKEPEQVSYYKHVRPLFQQHCQGCHQPAKPLGGFIMTDYAELLKKGNSDKPGVVPGKPELSYLVEQVTAHGDKKPSMPKGKDPLIPHDVELITKWIAQGAKDDTPASAREVVDADHPPAYVLPPVLSALAYSPDGQFLAVSGYHEVLVHKADGSELVARLVGLSERIQSLAFSPDGTLLAVAGGSPCRFGEIQVWDVAKKKLKLSLSVTFDTLYGVSWSPDGSKIAFGCADNTVRAIDAGTGQQVLYQGTHDDWVLGTTFSTDGEYLVSVSRDRSMRLTEVATQRFIDNVTSITPGALKDGLLTVARRPLKEKKMVKSPPDPAEHLYNEILCAGADGTPRLYKMHREVKRVIGDDANKIREFEPMPGRVFSVSFDAEGTLFVAGSSLEGRGEARVYQANDGKLLAKLEGEKGAVYAVAFRPDGKQVASAGFDGVVRLNDPQTGKLIKEFVPVPLKATGVASSK
jgi:WD40 repeat protein/mono/diheme cytochrome c family protein